MLASRVARPSVEPREPPMTIVGPLSIAAAYASLIFVAAIVFGVF